MTAQPAVAVGRTGRSLRSLSRSPLNGSIVRRLMGTTVEAEPFLRRLAHVFLECRLGRPEPAREAFGQARDILNVGGPNGWYLLGEIVRQAEGEDAQRWASELALECWMGGPRMWRATALNSAASYATTRGSGASLTYAPAYPPRFSACLMRSKGDLGAV